MGLSIYHSLTEESHNDSAAVTPCFASVARLSRLQPSKASSPGARAHVALWLLQHQNHAEVEAENDDEDDVVIDAASAAGLGRVCSRC